MTSARIFIWNRTSKKKRRKLALW